MCENSSRHSVASGSRSVPSRTIVDSTSPQSSSIGSSRPPTTRPRGSMSNPIALRLEHFHDANVAVDFEEGPVWDAPGGAGDADDGGDAELAGHDDGVAHFGAHVDDDGL